MNNSQSQEQSPLNSEERLRPRGINRFGGYFAKLKQAISRLAEPSSSQPETSSSTEAMANHNDSQDEHIQDNEIDLVEPLPTNFGVSEKRKRLSIQGHPTDESIPRSLTRGMKHPRHTSYLNLYNEIKTNEEESHNDLERRKSVIDSLVVASKDNSVLTSRDDSPAIGIPFPNQSIVVNLSMEEDEGEAQENGYYNQPQEEDQYEQLAIVQIDPAERSRIVRLKRSIQEMELMRKKMKYMKSPNETTTTTTTTMSHGDSTMVDTSTQTYNTDYLNSVLNFKKRSSSSYLEKNSNKKRKRGFFLKEFVYDVKKPVDVVTSTNLKGYASEVSKPKFKGTSDDSDFKLNLRPNRNGIALGQKLSLSLDSDYLAKTQSISDIIKLKEDSLKVASGNKSEVSAPSSGFKFDIDDKKIREIVGSANKETRNETTSKEKESLVGSEAKTSEKTTAPLFPFKSASSDGTNKSKEETPKPTGFSFGQKKDDKAESLQEKPKPAVSFGKGSTGLFGKPEPSKSSDEKSPSPFTFGSAKPSTAASNTDVKEEKEKPTFGFSFNPRKSAPFTGFASKPSGGLFGQQGDNKKDSATRIVNGSSNAPTAVAFSAISQPKVSSEPSKDDKGTQLDEDESEERDTKRKRVASSDESEPSEGAAEVTPKSATPLFGSSSGANKEESKATAPSETASKPAFSFGFNPLPSSTNDEDKLKSTTPAGGFMFGKSDSTGKDKPTSGFTFGQPTATSTNDDKNKPTTTGFSFAKSDEKAKSASPALLFGKTTEDKSSSSTTSSPAFSFGKPEEKSKSAAPLFSFGSNASAAANEDKGKSPSPAFTFGQVGKDKLKEQGSDEVKTGTSSTPTPTSGGSSLGFSFGNAGTAASSTTEKQHSAAPATTGFKFAPGVTPPPPTGADSTAAPTTNLFGAKTGSGSASDIAAPKPFSSMGFSGFGAKPQAQPSATTPAAPATAFGSRPSTPSFSFSGAAAPSASSGQGQGQGTAGATSGGLPPPSQIFGSATKLNKVPLFNFTGSKSGTPDPASVFGQHSQQPQQQQQQQQQQSREGTPFGGAAVPSFGFGQPQQQSQPFMFGGSPAPTGQTPSFGFGNPPPGGMPMMGNGFAPNGQQAGAPTATATSTATPPQANPRRPKLLPRSRRR